MRSILTSTVLLFLAAVPAAAARSDPLPGDVVAIVEFRNLDSLLADVQTFAETAQPGLTTEFVKMGFEELVRSSGFAGMQTDGVVKVLVLDPRKHPSPVVVVVPLADPDEYCEAVAGKLPDAAPAVRDGLTVFKQKVSYFDHEAYREALAGKDNARVIRHRFMKEREEERFLGFAGPLGVFAEAAPACKHVQALIREGKVKDGRMAGLEGATAVRVDAARFADGFDEMISNALAALRNQTAGAVGAAGDAAMKPEQVAAILELEAATLLTVVRQVRTLELAVTLNLDGIHITQQAEPEPDSILAGYLARQKPSDRSALKLLPPGTIAMLDMPMNDISLIIEPYLEVLGRFSAILAKPGAEPVPPGEFRELMGKWAAVFDGEYAVAWVRCPQREGGFDLAYVIGVADPARAREMVKDYPAMFKSMAAFSEGAGVKVRFEPLEGKREHRGTEIHAFSYEIALPDGPKPAGFPDFLLGKGTTLCVAVEGNRQLMTWGTSAEKLIEEMISRSRDGAPSFSDTAEYKAAMRHLAEPEESEPMASVFWSTGELCQWLASSGQAGAEAYGAVVPGPGAAARVCRKDGVWVTRFVIPMNEFLTIRGAIDAYAEVLARQLKPVPRKPRPQQK